MKYSNLKFYKLFLQHKQPQCSCHHRSSQQYRGWRLCGNGKEGNFINTPHTHVHTQTHTSRCWFLLYQPDLCIPVWWDRNPVRSCSNTRSCPQYPNRNPLYTPPHQKVYIHLHLKTGREKAVDVICSELVNAEWRAVTDCTVVLSWRIMLPWD